MSAIRQRARALGGPRAVFGSSEANGALFANPLSAISQAFNYQFCRIREALTHGRIAASDAMDWPIKHGEVPSDKRLCQTSTKSSGNRRPRSSKQCSHFGLI